MARITALLERLKSPITKSAKFGWRSTVISYSQDGHFLEMEEIEALGLDPIGTVRSWPEGDGLRGKK